MDLHKHIWEPDESKKELQKEVHNDHVKKVNDAVRTVESEIASWLGLRPQVFRLLEIGQTHAEFIGGRMGKPVLDNIADYLEKRIKEQNNNLMFVAVYSLLKSEIPTKGEYVYGYDEYSHEWVKVEIAKHNTHGKVEYYFIQNLKRFPVEQMHRWADFPLLDSETDEMKSEPIKTLFECEGCGFQRLFNPHGWDRRNHCSVCKTVTSWVYNKQFA